jgi:hypothetical protein
MLRPPFFLVACVMAGCLFSSCAVRLSDGQAQALSEAAAGAAVILDDDLWGSLDPTSRERIAHGVAGFIKGATQQAELPPPAFVPAKIAADPIPFEDAGAKSARSPETGYGAGVWGAVGAGGLALLGLLRFVPGAGGLVANLAYAYIAPKVDRITDAKAHQLYQHGAAVVEYGVQMAKVAEVAAPDLAGEIQDRAIALQNRLGIRKTVADLVAAAKAKAASDQQYRPTPAQPAPPAS